MTNHQTLIDNIRLGDKRDLARLLSEVENGNPAIASIVSELVIDDKQAYRLGVTGPPGAGKSSLTTQLVKLFRKSGKKVAVIAVDPTSPFTGGALLGDRIRMNEIMMDPGVFIRSMATRGSLGGLAIKAAEVSRVIEAAGYELIIFETVGVGQSELDIVNAADTTIVALVPESGDSIQAMKAGLMEIADIFVMNKSDRTDSDKAVQALESSLQLRNHTIDTWITPVLKTVAIRNLGIEELQKQIALHHQYLLSNGLLAKKREERDKDFIKKLVEEMWHKAFWTEDRTNSLNQTMLKRLSPYQVAKIIYEMKPSP